LLNEVEKPNINYLIKAISFRYKPISFPIQFLKTATGRSATLLILNYFKKIGIIKNQNTTIIVPKWICISYLQLLRKHCSPILKVNTSAKVALIYHQYGFPQNMEEIEDYCLRKNITIVENCAHSFESYYKGKRLGTFGYASLFSFSKLFPSIWGGGLATRNKELFEFAQQEQNALNSSWISNFLHLTKYKLDQSVNRNNIFWNNANEMAYGCAEYAQKMNKLSYKIISHKLNNNALTIRKENYLFVLNYFKDTDYFFGLEKEEVVPYVAPLFTNTSRLIKIKSALLENKINTGIYNFDVNRNLFNPYFKKCLWIPIHSGINTDRMEMICSIISRVA
jgi:dTDP-4-amino-4,6-dideoxygalactose transaminase